MTSNQNGEIAQSSLDFRVYDETQYFDAVSNDIDTMNTGNFISMSTMGLDPLDAKTQQVLTALSRAAERRNDVALAVDNFSFLDSHKLGPIGQIPFGDLGNEKRIGKYLADFRESSPYIFSGLTNYPIGTHAPIYTGRSHIKSATVGDKLYVGGISLDATRRLDAMASFVHPDLAWWVNKLNRQSIIQQSVRNVLGGEDVEFTFDKNTDSKLLVDAGVRGQSKIYDEMLGIIDDAEERIIYSSEQFPSGKVGKHLLQAFNRGVEVNIGVNGPEKHDRYQKIHKIILDRAKAKLPKEFFDYELPVAAPTLHTKAVASELRAMIGSHNLNRIGVMLGTAEMDIVSSDADFVSKVGSLVLRQIQTKQDVRR